MDRMKNAVSVVGLGRLGLPLAVCLAHKGFQVIGVDINRERIEAVRRRSLSGSEPGLKEALESAGDRLTTTESLEDAVHDSPITIILVPTPTEPSGGFSLQHVLAACERIGRALRTKSEFHVVGLSSTVMPGATGGPVQFTLERFSGKRAGVDFGLCYNPEFVALGNVIHDLVHPDFILIGESDPKAGEALEALYRQVCENTPPVARMNFVNAELTKLAVNTFVTTKITMGNTLARLCEQLPGADVDTVTNALGLDRRIGRQYLRGAIGYGGPCFPRDNQALAALARQLGTAAALAEVTDRTNREQVHQLAAFVKSKRRSGERVGVLGLSYKPQTDVVDESQGLLLARLLSAEGIPVIAYDPVAMGNAANVLSGSIQFAPSLARCLEEADVVVIATPWEVFTTIDPISIERTHSPRVLIDCWRLLDRKRFGGVTEYIALGIGPADGVVTPSLVSNTVS